MRIKLNPNNEIQLIETCENCIQDRELVDEIIKLCEYTTELEDEIMGLVAYISWVENKVFEFEDEAYRLRKQLMSTAANFQEA